MTYMFLQLADLDNKLRRKRSEGGLESSWKPRQLSELDKLPKPWHTEYWTDSTLLEGSSLPFTLRPLASSISKPDPLLDRKVGALQPPPSLPELPKSVELRKEEETPSSSPKFSFDEMVLAREKALPSKDKSPIPVERKKPGFRYSGSSAQVSTVAKVLPASVPVVCAKQEKVVGNKSRSRSSSVESSSWEYYTETEPEDSD